MRPEKFEDGGNGKYLLQNKCEIDPEGGRYFVVIETIEIVVYGKTLHKQDRPHPREKQYCIRTGKAIEKKKKFYLKGIRKRMWRENVCYLKNNSKEM